MNAVNTMNCIGLNGIKLMNINKVNIYIYSYYRL